MAYTAEYNARIRVTSAEGQDRHFGSEQEWAESGPEILTDMIDAFVGEMTRLAGGGFEVKVTLAEPEAVAA